MKKISDLFTRSDTKTLDIEEIMYMLPHRYPMLLVDRVIDLVKDKKIVAVKNVTYNEPHFTGHFPNKPVMPGVLIIEAMAQAAAILAIVTFGKESIGKLVYFMSIEEAKFRKLVVPGDVMILNIEKVKSRGMVCKFYCEALVNDKRVAEATISAMISEDKSSAPT